MRTGMHLANRYGGRSIAFCSSVMGEGKKLGSFRIIIVVMVCIGSLWTGSIEVSAQTSDALPGTAERTDPQGNPVRLGEQAIPLGAAPPVDIPANQGAVSFFTILRMILVLALAAGAIYGLVFLLKRLSRPPEQKDPYLKVLAGVHLGSNRFVHAIALGSQAWLVGASEGGVSLIAELNDRETIDAMLLDASRKHAEPGEGKGLDFAQLLRRLGGEAGPDPQAKLKAENVRKRRERLKGL
ncbi:MAG: flagellar biosynthetic protein FliO [Treponema sp.]|nr:flagellar biosynthetic protein FliO [Treponema sp.]